MTVPLQSRPLQPSSDCKLGKGQNHEEKNKTKWQKVHAGAQFRPRAGHAAVGLQGFNSWSEAVGLHTPGCCGCRAREEMILFWDRDEISEKQFDMAQSSLQPP